MFAGQSGFAAHRLVDTKFEGVEDSTSRRMRAVRTTDTAPEIAVRRILHKAGYRFRIHQSSLPGKPDIVLPRHSIAIQVRGCFWHMHTCTRFKLPSKNREAWARKLSDNVLRDKRKDEELRKRGYRVVVIWECEANQESLVLARIGELTKGKRS